MNEIFEKIYNDNNTSLNEDTALFEKVYTEAEMLNEMNPKLRALLAAGLIGTAGLGAASCSMPTDNSSDVQYTIEQPTPENPEEIEEIEDSEDPEDSEEITDSEEPTVIEQPASETTNPDNLDNPGDNCGDTEEVVTFESLGVQPEHAARLAGADKYEDNVITIITIDDYNSFIYKNNEDGFVSVEFDRDGEYKDGSSYISYINDTDDTNWYLYYVPTNMESDFDAAIAVYKK